MDDRELLDEFVKKRSQSAFHDLVTRHLPVVYSAARRMVRDTHLAEEVAQSVFATLAQKAETIRPPQVLGGWLYNTTRHLAMHAVRTEQRRREREQIACAMQSLDQPTDVPEIAEHLEPAMAELESEDRDALVLRYLAGRGLREVGVELGVSEEAARKRVSRALDRLRIVLEQRSVSVTTVLLATALTSSVFVVPSGLVATVSTAALIPAAAAVTKATLITVKTKMVLASMAGVLAVGVGTAAFVLQQAKPPAATVIVTNAPTAAPVATVKWSNDAFLAGPGYIETIAVAGQQFGPALLTLGANLKKDDRFLNDVDPKVRRTTNSPPAGHIKCLVEPTSPGSTDYLASTRTQDALQASRFTFHLVSTNSPLLGKRIRATGWLKTTNVEVMAAATLVIIGSKGQIFADDPMTDRPVRETTDWKQIEIITDVPSEPCTIYFGPVLYGPGELWADDFQISVAPADAPITDDRIWHVWSPNPGDYSVTNDFEVSREGRPALRLTYTPEGAAPVGSWMWWGQCIRTPDEYKGRTVRMTVWTKSENVSDYVRPNLRPKGSFFRLLAQDKRVGGKSIRGNTDWMKNTIVCDIPEGTQCLDTGFAFRGSGKVWIDMGSLKYEIIETPEKPQ